MRINLDISVLSLYPSLITMDKEILGGFQNIHLIVNPVSGQGVVPVEEIRSKFQVLGDRLTVVPAR